jgi:hypothetical protein
VNRSIYKEVFALDNIEVYDLWLEKCSGYSMIKKINAYSSKEIISIRNAAYNYVNSFERRNDRCIYVKLLEEAFLRKGMGLSWGTQGYSAGRTIMNMLDIIHKNNFGPDKDSYSLLEPDVRMLFDLILLQVFEAMEKDPRISLFMR